MDFLSEDLAKLRKRFSSSQIPYRDLIKELEPEYSDRNLVSLLSALVGKPYEVVLNDIYKERKDGYQYGF